MHRPYTLMREGWRDKVRGKFSGDDDQFPTQEELAGQREKIKATGESLARKLADVTKKSQAIAKRLDEAFGNIGRTEGLMCRAEGLVEEAETFLRSLDGHMSDLKDSFKAVNLAIDLSQIPPSKNLKVDKLSDSLLDLWVARAGELDAYLGEDGKCYVVVDSEPAEPYQPTIDWSRAGPIIERERIEFEWQRNNTWYASIDFNNGKYIGESGSTQLESGMRCFVSSKLGDEVPKENDAKDD